MLKRIFLILFLGALYSANGQKYTEVGMNFGVAGMQGDLNRTLAPWTVLIELRPSLGAELRHYFSPRHNLYTTVRVVHLHAADKNHGFSQRGYILNTNLTTVEVRYEFNFRPYSRHKTSVKFTVDDTWWTPYFGFGIGNLYYNPNIQYPGSKLPPEIANRVDFTWDYHYALGLKFDLPRGMGMALEFNHHLTRTDRLDALPIEGSANDWYYQGTVSFYFLLLKRGYF